MTIMAIGFVYAQNTEEEFADVPKKENTTVSTDVNKPATAQVKEIKNPMDLLSYNLSLIVLGFGTLNYCFGNVHHF